MKKADVQKDPPDGKRKETQKEAPCRFFLSDEGCRRGRWAEDASFPVIRRISEEMLDVWVHQALQRDEDEASEKAAVSQ